MRGHQATPEQALAELRRQLDDGLALSRLSKTQLATKAQLSRTIVYEALRAEGPVPSSETVSALATVLKLPVEELLTLRRCAATPASPAAGRERGPGRPLSAWDPHDLEVHPAGPAAGVREQRVLPGYVPRQHDRVLADAVRGVTLGRSRMLVLVGTSSTGKTRACWEAVQPLAALGWRLWHPFQPGRAEAALEDLHRVTPRTVVWLNEAQHYIGDSMYGERIAAALHDLLITPERAPVLVLGTLWPGHADRYMALPLPSQADLHSRARELLSGRRVPVPDTFDKSALVAARALAKAGDALLADALSRAYGHGRVAQDLAGAPELLRRYEDGSPGAKAVLEAAMDARRLGAGPYLPQAFLTDAALDYLTEADYQQLSEDWAEAAYAELAHPAHGKQAPLHRVRQRPPRHPPGNPPSTDALASTLAGPVFRLADYLEQHGRALRRRQCPPASFWYAAHTHLTSPDDLGNLAEAARHRHRLQWAHHLHQRAADAGNPDALYQLAAMREKAGDRQGAESLAQRAADAGSPGILFRLAEIREETGDEEGAEALLLRAADAGVIFALYRLIARRIADEDRGGAEALLLRAVDAGESPALCVLAVMRDADWDWERANVLLPLDRDIDALNRLIGRREEAGDQEGAKALARVAAEAGDARRVWLPDETLARLAADYAGATSTRFWPVALRVKAGDREGVEALAQQAAEAGDSATLGSLAMMLEEAEDRQGTEALLRLVCDVGADFDCVTRRPLGQTLARMWPHGLDPDGTPTAPWQ
ncbi:hypothetical protein GCM10027072_76760 [Streptomyces bullii]